MSINLSHRAFSISHFPFCITNLNLNMSERLSGPHSSDKLLPKRPLGGRNAIVCFLSEITDRKSVVKLSIKNQSRMSEIYFSRSHFISFVLLQQSRTALFSCWIFWISFPKKPFHSSFQPGSLSSFNLSGQ